jgi:hypothetical protein
MRPQCENCGFKAAEHKIVRDITAKLVYICPSRTYKQPTTQGKDLGKALKLL